MKRLIAVLSLAFFSSLFTVQAQVPTPNEAGVAMGHFHVYVTDLQASKKLWTDYLRGTAIKIDGVDVIKIPGTLIFLEQASGPVSGEGSVINHIAFFALKSKDLLDKWAAAGFKLTINDPKVGDHGFIYTPENLRIEIQEDHLLKEGQVQTVSIITDHIHFNWPTNNGKEGQAWYAKLFGATTVGAVEADIPDMRLRWAVARPPKPVLPSKGAVIDHLGFEVRNLEAFCKKLEADGIKFDEPYSKTRHKSFASTELTDPWGVHLELTEGLNKF